MNKIIILNMDLNYTPLNINQSTSVKADNSNDKITMILIIIATITAAILASLLFFLIQRKLQKKDITPAVSIENVVNKPSPTVFPSIQPTSPNFPSTGSANLNQEMKTGTNPANLVATASSSIVRPTITITKGVSPR